MPCKESHTAPDGDVSELGNNYIGGGSKYAGVAEMIFGGGRQQTSVRPKQAKWAQAQLGRDS